MSKMKKVLACLLAAALVTTSVVPAFAADSPQTPPTASDQEAQVGTDAWEGTTNAPTNAEVETSKEGTATVGAVESSKKKVEVSETVKVDGVDYIVTELAPKAFSECKKAATITVNVSPEADTYTVGKNAFLGCAGVKIVINAKNFSGWTIKKGAFGKHSGKKTIVLRRPNGKSYTAKQRKKIKKLLKDAGFKGTVKF